MQGRVAVSAGRGAAERRSPRMGVPVQGAAAGQRGVPGAGIGSVCAAIAGEFLEAGLSTGKRAESRKDPGKFAASAAGFRHCHFFGFGRDVAGVQDVDGVFGDSEQEALPGGVDDDNGGLLADTLSADNSQRAVGPPPSRALAEPALQEPHEAKHRAQGHEYPQPKDQCVHSAKSLGNVEDAGDPDSVVLVQDHHFAVGDQPAVEQDVCGGAGGAVEFNDLSGFEREYVAH